METITSDLVKTTCAHCEREIPTSNIDLHYVHCSRNLQKCPICGDMVPTKLSDEHYRESHAPIDCSLCGEAVEREAWTVHKGERCQQRMVTCEYCEFPLPAVDLIEHQEICGNRTEYCQMCNRYVRLREQIAHENQFHGNRNGTAESAHENQFHGNGNGTAESSRDAQPTEREEDAHVHEREPQVHRREQQNSPKRHILFTIAAAGLAVLIGSIFLQQGKEPEQ